VRHLIIAVVVFCSLLCIDALHIANGSQKKLLRSLNGIWIMADFARLNDGRRVPITCSQFTWSGTGSRRRHNINCSVSGIVVYNFRVAANFTFGSNGNLRGTWVEANFSVSGTQSGRISGASPKSYRITGNAFRANWSNTFTGCRQTVGITEMSTIIRRMQVSGRKSGC